MGSQAVAERDVTIRIPKDYAAFLVSEAQTLLVKNQQCLVNVGFARHHLRKGQEGCRSRGDGDGDLELSAPPGVLSYLASERILADAENIPSAWGDAFLQDRRAGDVRQLADRLLFWIKTWESLGAMTAAEAEAGAQGGPRSVT